MGSWCMGAFQRAMIQHSFVKCGLSNKLDGSENSLVNIKGIEDYELPQPGNEFTLLNESESEENRDGDHYIWVEPADMDLDISCESDSHIFSINV